MLSIKLKEAFYARNFKYEIAIVKRNGKYFLKIFKYIGVRSHWHVYIKIVNQFRTGTKMIKYTIKFTHFV